MAKNIEININNGSNSYETLYPKTLGGLVEGNVSSANTANTLATARTIQTNLGSTSASSFNGSSNITPGISGTLGVSNGGTGVTSYSSLASKISPYFSSSGLKKTGGYISGTGSTTFNLTIGIGSTIPVFLSYGMSSNGGYVHPLYRQVYGDNTYYGLGNDTNYFLAYFHDIQASTSISGTIYGGNGTRQVFLSIKINSSNGLVTIDISRLGSTSLNASGNTYAWSYVYY